MTQTVQLHVLGRFEALGPDGTAAPLTSKKAQALLGYLAVESGRAHSRDELATLLWGDMDEERSRHNLRQTLSKIRRTLGEGVLSSRDDALQLDPQRCETDVSRFRTLLRRGDPEARLEALGLYRHDLLRGLTTREDPFEDWLRDARTELHERACNAMQTLASGLEAEGRVEQAMALYRRRLTFDPACEEAHRELMILLDRQGRRSDALRQFAICEEALARYLHTAPGPETLSVHERIRSGRSEAPSPAPAPPEPAVVPVASMEPALADPPALAVLPFQHLGGSEDDRYFTDGITEDITTELSRFGSLLVVARASAYRYRDREPDLEEVGRELGVEYVVQGSVRRAGERVRINVQLVEVRSGSHVWAQRFDRELKDIFEVQDEVTATVVSTLAGRVEAAQREHARRIAPEALDAYRCVLRGKDHHHRYSRDDCEVAVRMFRDAIARDPDYAVAHAWLACGLGQAMVFFPEERARLLDEAEAAAERGRQLDDDESECHRILAQVGLLRHDLDRALSHQQRAIKLNPNSDQIVAGMGEVLSYVGRNEEAAEWVRRAMRLNPYHPDGYWTHLGRALFNLERHDDAAQAMRRITRPRVSDQILQLAVEHRRGVDTRDLLLAIRERRPEVTADAFIEATPFPPGADRDRLLATLREAGL